MRHKILLKVFSFSVAMACGQLAVAQNTITYVPGSTQKIEQLVGDYDRQLQRPTKNLTGQRFGVHATDLGVPFEHKGRTYVAFGDIPPASNDRDPLAYTTDTTPEDGISLEFVTNLNGLYRPIDIPGVSMKGFEVPMEGVSWHGNMYMYATTDVMKRSVVAKSTDDGRNFTKLYDLSSSRFINVTVVKAKASEGYPEPADTDIQVMLGSGQYRQSSVYLAYQRADLIEEKRLQYFRGLENGTPLWTQQEAEAVPVFNQPCVGELSLSYNQLINKWILLYNCDSPRGINCRTADKPWGPWSDPFVIFDPAATVDKGYCYFMHSNWAVNRCDNVHDPGRENEWGGEYGAYQFEDLATGNSRETTIYYTMSTWNPYTVVLMKSTLRDNEATPTAASDELLENFKVYPNPATDKVELEFKNSSAGAGTVELRDLQGRKVKEEQIVITGGDAKHEMATHGLAAGLYLLHVKLPNSTKPLIRKIMVQVN